MNLLIILLFIRMTKIMDSMTKKETDVAASASLQLNNQLILIAIIMMLFILIIA